MDDEELIRRCDRKVISSYRMIEESRQLAQRTRELISQSRKIHAVPSWEREAEAAD
jgi:hypothetical protein